MSQKKKFENASAYQDDVLALPVRDIDAASKWYSSMFGMREVGRTESPCPAVELERDGVRIGFAQNGGDPEQDGAAIRVSDLAAIRDELESRGVKTGNWRVDTNDGQKFQVFFVVAPDGLCYYFHEPLSDESPASG